MKQINTMSAESVFHTLFRKGQIRYQILSYFREFLKKQLNNIEKNKDIMISPYINEFIKIPLSEFIHNHNFKNYTNTFTTWLFSEEKEFKVYFKSFLDHNDFLQISKDLLSKVKNKKEVPKEEIDKELKLFAEKLLLEEVKKPTTTVCPRFSPRNLRVRKQDCLREDDNNSSSIESFQTKQNSNCVSFTKKSHGSISKENTTTVNKILGHDENKFIKKINKSIREEYNETFNQKWDELPRKYYNNSTMEMYKTLFAEFKCYVCNTNKIDTFGLNLCLICSNYCHRTCFKTQLNLTERYKHNLNICLNCIK